MQPDEPCTGADIERLLPTIAAISSRFQQVQIEIGSGLSPRDQMIVSVATLDFLRRAADKAVRQNTGGLKFLRSIRNSIVSARLMAQIRNGGQDK